MPEDAKQMIRVERVGEVDVVRFREPRIVDSDLIQKLGQELFDLVEKDGRGRILLNFDSVRYIGSALVGKLVLLKEKVNDVGGELVITNFHEDFLKVFKILRLEHVFTIIEGEAAALESFKTA